MTRPSQLSSLEDFSLEVRRESIRNQRWMRRRNMILTFALVYAVLDGKVESLLNWLIRSL